MRLQLMKEFHGNSGERRSPPPPSTDWMMLRRPVMVNQRGAPNQASSHQSLVSMKVSMAGMKPMVIFNTFFKWLLR